MFRLSVVDHVRLNFGHAIQNYTVHARAAARLSGVAASVRIVVLALLTLATASTITSLIEPSRPMQIAATAAACLAFIGHALYMALGFESRVYAHRSCAHRLWLVCERYRSLLAETQDGLLDRASVLQRRDALLEQLHAVYEQAFPPDHQAYETLRQPAQGRGKSGFSDEQIDEFLPASMRAHGEASAPAQ